MRDTHDAYDGTEQRATITRRALLGATAAGLAASSTPAAAASINSEAVDDTLTAAAVEAASDPRRRADALGDLHESNGDPTWIVEYSEGDLSSLEAWADGDADREILSAYTHTASRTAVVRATADDVGASLLARALDDGLASRDYVESIDANLIVELDEPVELSPEREAWPDYSVADRYLRYSGEPPVADGVAFDDVEPATMTDVRAAINGDDLTADPIVAVVDTGVNTAGGDLFGGSVTGGVDGTRVLDTSKNMISGETVADAGLDAIEDGNRHGSFVAAEIASDNADSAYKGVLPNARILGIRALDDEGSGSIANIARSIRYAADEGADVICLSLGSPGWSHELDRAVEYAAGAGTIAVAATGNDRMGTRWVAAPASTSRSISVASTTASAGEAEIRSSYYSNVGPHPGSTDLSGGESTGAEPDVGAPGHKITTARAKRDGSVTTETLSGTSMSAPLVAAVVAALGETDPETVRTRIEDTSAPISAAAKAEVGAGLVDADAAISNTSASEDQVDAMDDDAQVRDDAYRTESDSRGRALLEWL